MGQLWMGVKCSLIWNWKGLIEIELKDLRDHAKIYPNENFVKTLFDRNRKYQKMASQILEKMQLIL